MPTMTTPTESFETSAERELAATLVAFPFSGPAIRRRAERWRAAKAAVPRQRARVRACAHCGTVFQGKTTRARYCGDVCRRRAKNASRRVLPRAAACRWCGRAITGRTARAVHCGTECARAARNAVRRGTHRQRDCARCGVPFVPDRSTARYCGPVCAREAKNVARRAPRRSAVCRWCGTGLGDRSARAIYCSPVCRRSAVRASRTVPDRTTACAVCGTAFEAGRSTARYCGPACRTIADRRGRARRRSSGPRTTRQRTSQGRSDSDHHGGPREVDRPADHADGPRRDVVRRSTGIGTPPGADRSGTERSVPDHSRTGTVHRGPAGTGADR